MSTSNSTTSPSTQNRVLQASYQPSENFYKSDKALQHLLKKELQEATLEQLQAYLQYTGEQAAGKMNPLSLQADKQGPVLVKRDFLGNTINKVDFHPAYEALKDIAVQSGMFSLKWNPQERQKWEQERHRVGFATGSLYAMSESGLYCPLCMTDGAARLVAKYCTPEDQARLLPHIATTNVEELYTGAMFLTEKAGGSDVGANLVTATSIEGQEGYYHLNGEKWFCSNVNAEIIFALARTHPEVAGTRGLSIFLIEKTRPDGSPNPLEIVRLKDKLGVRSMASAECLLQDTWGKLIGEEQQGFKIMTDMINLSRLYNSVAAMGGLRRALIESYQFLNHRVTFGKNALEHPLVRTKVEELGALHWANFYMTWRSIRALDLADNGNKEEAALLRLLTPMLKRSTAATSVYVTREAMELMGGMGYIEDGVLPKIMRDMMVLPIWEGAGNIMLLDMLRASFKSQGLAQMLQEIHYQFDKVEEAASKNTLLKALKELENLLPALQEASPAVMQATAKPAFEALTQLYQIACLIEYKDEVSKEWIAPALAYFVRLYQQKQLCLQEPIAVETLHQLLAWEV